MQTESLVPSWFTRFKHDIEPMEHSSEVIYRLKPVSFRYNAEIEPTCPREIAKVRNSSQTLQKLRTKATQVR